MIASNSGAREILSMKNLLELRAKGLFYFDNKSSYKSTKQLL